jgi:hypothetical protein
VPLSAAIKKPGFENPGSRFSFRYASSWLIPCRQKLHRQIVYLLYQRERTWQIKNLFTGLALFAMIGQQYAKSP